MKKTIEAQPESFDLIPLLRENWSSLVEIEHARSRRQFEKLVDDIPKLRRILIQSGYKEAETPLIMQVTPQSESEIRIAHRVIPDFSVLNAVELAHREGDVLDAIWVLSSLRQDGKETPSLSPAANARIEEASRLMLTWFAIGPTEATQQLRTTILRGPSDALRISIGLVDFAGMMAHMVHHLSGIPLSELFKASKEGRGDSSTAVKT